MKIKVISLLNSERRAEVDRRLQPIIFQYFDAVNVNNDERKILFDQNIARTVYGRDFRNGEIGCSISHKLAIDEFYNDSSQDEWLVIFEDDVLPEKSLFPFLKSLDSLSLDDPTIMLLGHTHTRKETLLIQRLKQPLSNKITINNEKLGINNFINYCGAVGYAINISAARLINMQKKVFWYPDDWIKISNFGIKIYHPLTPFVYEDYNLNSTLEHEKIDFHSLSRNPIRQMCKILISQYRHKMNLNNPNDRWFYFF